MTTDAERLLTDLDSADQHVRAQAAVALARMRHPRALEACIRTLDDAEEEAHADSTPAVYCLGEMGMHALPPLLDKLMAEQPMTRLHAQRAVEALSRRLFGFDGRRWPEGKYQQWASWWTNVAYTYDAPDDGREAAVARLRAWMQSRPAEP